MHSDHRYLLRLGGFSGLLAAVTVPLFVVLFYGIFPIFGFDPARFSDPDYVLAFFADYPSLIRLTGLINLVTMTASILLMGALAYRLETQGSGQAIVGGALGILGWLMVLIGEHADLSAFIHLSQRYAAEPELAKSGFALAVALGRQARGWGYLLLALSLAVFAGPLGRAAWPRALRWITVGIIPFALLLFLFDNVLVIDTGSVLFALVFGPAGVLLAIWNGWTGWRLWKETSRS